MVENHAGTYSSSPPVLQSEGGQSLNSDQVGRSTHKHPTSQSRGKTKKFKGTAEHRIFPWVQTKKGDEDIAIDDEELVEQYGVPARVLLSHVKEEIKNDEAFRSLPLTIVLVLMYSVSFLNHVQARTVRDQEAAITIDLTENAVFAFVDPGAMAHKSLQDVHYFADVYTWLRLGFLPILFRDSQLWSENPTFSNYTVPLNDRERHSYLQHHNLIGGVQLAQARTKSDTCINSEVAEKFGISCFEVQQKADVLDLRVEPETEDIKPHAAKREIDPTLTRWLLFVEERESLSLRLQQLEVTNWIDRSTSEVVVSFMTYNAQFDMLTMTEVYFFFSQSGHIWKNIMQRSLILKPYKDLWYVVSDVLFMLLKLRIMTAEILEIFSQLRTGRQRGWSMKVSLQQYFNIWNLVDWISIVSALMVMAMWYQTCAMTSDVVDVLLHVGDLVNNQSMFGSSQAWKLQGNIEELFNVFRDADFYNHIFGTWASLYPVVLMLRLFKAFDSQPRLAMVTSTLSRASTDVIHFGIVFLAIFMTFAMMACALFGKQIEEFSTFPRAMTSCFVMLMGEFDVVPLWDTGRTLAVMWFVSFQCVTALILLNMLLAIIMDTYTEVKNSLSNKATIRSHITTLVRRWIQLKRGQRLSLYEIEVGVAQRCTKVLDRSQMDLFQLAESSTNSRSKNLRDADCCAWDSSEILTVEGFQESVPNLRHDQAKRLLVKATERWRLECETTAGLSETLHEISKMHGRLEKFIEKFKSQGFGSKAHTPDNEPDTPTSPRPFPTLEPSILSRLDFLTKEVTEMKQKQGVVEQNHTSAIRLEISGDGQSNTGGHITSPDAVVSTRQASVLESRLDSLATEVTEMKQQLAQAITLLTDLKEGSAGGNAIAIDRSNVIVSHPIDRGAEGNGVRVVHPNHVMDPARHAERLGITDNVCHTGCFGLKRE